MARVTCDQCGQPIDAGNTGTVCTDCLRSVMRAAGFKGLVQATSTATNTSTITGAGSGGGGGKTPFGKAVHMSSTPPTPPIYVEYDAKVMVEIDMDDGGVTNIITVLDKPTATPTGNLFMSNTSQATFQPAVVPTPPPKFSSPEEADAWLEANTGKVKTDAVEITQKEHDVALDIAKNIDWDAWL